MMVAARILSSDNIVTLIGRLTRKFTYDEAWPKEKFSTEFIRLVLSSIPVEKMKKIPESNDVSICNIGYVGRPSGILILDKEIFIGVAQIGIYRVSFIIPARSIDALVGTSDWRGKISSLDFLSPQIYSLGSFIEQMLSAGINL